VLLPRAVAERLPQAAVRCLFRSPMALADAFAAGSGRVPFRWRGASFVRHGTGRCFCRRQRHGASFVRQWHWQMLLPQAAARCLFRSPWHRQVPLPQAAARCLFRSPMALADAFAAGSGTVPLSFAMALAGAFAALRRPSRGRQAAPSALPGPAPAPLAAARCLHSLSLPDGPASIRSCSTPPLAASMPLVLEAFSRSASGDGATKPRCGSFMYFAATARR